MSTEGQLLCFPQEALVQTLPWSSPCHCLLLGLWSFPMPPASNSVCLEFLCPLLQSFLFGSRKGNLRWELRCQSGKSSLSPRWSFQSLFRPHAVSFEAKQMIECWFQGTLDVSYKIKLCWSNSSVTPAALVGQVLQEWSKKYCKNINIFNYMYWGGKKAYLLWSEFRLLCGFRFLSHSCLSVALTVVYERGSNSKAWGRWGFHLFLMVLLFRDGCQQSNSILMPFLCIRRCVYIIHPHFISNILYIWY